MSSTTKKARSLRFTSFCFFLFSARLVRDLKTVSCRSSDFPILTPNTDYGSVLPPCFHIKLTEEFRSVSEAETYPGQLVELSWFTDLTRSMNRIHDEREKKRSK